MVAFHSLGKRKCFGVAVPAHTLPMRAQCCTAEQRFGSALLPFALRGDAGVCKGLRAASQVPPHT